MATYFGINYFSQHTSISAFLVTYICSPFLGVRSLKNTLKCRILQKNAKKMVIKSSLNGKNAGSGANFVDFQAQYSICDNFAGVEGILECQGATGNQINSMLQLISGGGG